MKITTQITAIKRASVRIRDAKINKGLKGTLELLLSLQVIIGDPKKFARELNQHVINSPLPNEGAIIYFLKQKGLPL